MNSFAEGLSGCPHCGAKRALRPEPRLLGSSVPMWLRSLFRRLQLERGGSAPTTERDIEARLEKLQQTTPKLRIDGLAVVCCYFNPCGFRSRAENYRRFAEALCESGVKLLTVELAIGDADHQLPKVYGDLLKVRSDAVLWHKERLLNLGIQQLLSEGFEQIVWLDADVEFVAAKSWPWFIAEALETSPLCQAFSSLVADTGARPVPAMSAVRHFEHSGEVIDQATVGPRPRRPLGLAMGMPGYGWAARASLLRDCDLYDRAIMGGGDKLIFAGAVCDQARRSEVAEFVNSPFLKCAQCGRSTGPGDVSVDHLLQWAARWYDGVGGRPAVADLAMKVMFHGSWVKRSYWLRQEVLSMYEFDPVSDLRLNEDGCWEWASDKPEFHAHVAKYFESRDEDGN